MVKREFNAKSAWKRASDLYDQRRFEDCLNELEKIVDNNISPAFVCYVKSTVLREMGKDNAALEELDRSLRFDPSIFLANQARAQLLYNTNGDLNEALTNINIAIVNYSPDDLADSLGDANSLSSWIKEYVAARSDMVNLKTSIESDIRSNILYDRMQTVEESVDVKLREERMRSIEVIGVFSAILALILASAQGALNISGPDFLWLGLGLVVPISFLILLISPNQSMRWKPVLMLSVFIAGCIAIGVFVDRWFM